MGKLRVHNIEAQTGTNVDLGAAGDNVTIASNSIQTNLYKDSGGNTIFQSDGAGTLSNVNSGLAGGGWKHLLTQNADGSSTTLEFSSTYITSTYTAYAVVVDGYYPTTNSRTLEFNMSIDNGASWKQKTTVFTKAYMDNSGGTYGIQTEQTWSRGSSTDWQELLHDAGGDYGNAENGSGILYLWTPSNSTFMNKFEWRGMNWRSISRIEDSMVVGRMEGTSVACNCIAFRTSDPYTMYGTFKLYGIA